MKQDNNETIQVKLEDLLEEDNIEAKFANLEDYKEWETYFSNSYSRRLKTDSSYIKKKRFCIDFMFQWSLRLKKQQNIPRKILQFSLFLYKYNCPQPIWNLLTKMKISVSKKKVKDILQRSKALILPKKLQWKESKGIIVLGMDNCAYYNNHSYIRDNTTPTFVNTINTYRRYWKNAVIATLSEESEVFYKDFAENQQQFRFVANFFLRKLTFL